MTTVLMAWRLALRSLQRNKLRATLTILGILIGVAAVTAMTALGAGAREQMASQMNALGVNMLVVYPGSTNTGGARGAAGTASGLTEEDAAAIAREVPSVAHVAPVLTANAQLVVAERNYSTRVTGTTPEYFAVRSWNASSGALFEASDLAARARVCLIGETVRRELFPAGSPLGAQMRVGPMPCTVIGVLASKGQSGMGQDQDDTVVMPLTTLRAHISRLEGTRINQIYVTARDRDAVSRAESATAALLRQRHRIARGADDDFSVRNLQELASTFDAQQSALTLLLLAVASISLLVGGIGVMNIMLVSVTERTREIGIRLAIGARSNDILAQFLVEAVSLSALGGLAGLAAGAGGSLLLGRLTAWSVSIQPASAALSFAVAGGIGVIFGFFPARRAAALDPIVALRHE